MNGLHVLFRAVRDCHLNLLAHLTAFMCVDVLKDMMFLVSLNTRQAMYHVLRFLLLNATQS